MLYVIFNVDFLARITCDLSSKADGPTPALVINIQLHYLPIYSCQTVRCAAQFHDKIYNKLRQLTRIILQTDSGIIIELILCSISDTPCKCLHFVFFNSSYSFFS